MADKPHVVLINGNSKKGKHVFNFDKYIQQLNYRMCSGCVTLELSSPIKKKQIDYNKFISPYEKIPECKICACTKKRSKTSQKVKPPPKKNLQPSKKTTDLLKKLSIQEVYNFSETPISFLSCFRNESYYNSAITENIYNRLFNKDNRKDSANDTTIYCCNRDRITNETNALKKLTESRRPMKKSQSETASALGRVKSHKNLRTCKSSVVFLQNKVEKLRKENCTLRKKLYRKK